MNKLNDFRPMFVPLAIVFLAVDSLLYPAALLELTGVVFAAGSASAVAGGRLLRCLRGADGGS